MKQVFSLLLVCLLFNGHAQSTIKGKLIEGDDLVIMYANVALYNTLDSTLVKVESSNEEGNFTIHNIVSGNYFFKATYVGYDDYILPDLEINGNQNIDLGEITMQMQSLGIEEVTVTAKRQMVVIKPDRTIFNVEGTVNNVGTDAISLLRKAPSVTVDNNDNVSVLGRSGVIIYIDGKRIPLSGDDLSNYLKNITSDQIDRIDIITSPSAKYEAEGNAGIIDIILKKDVNLGANGSVGGTFSQGLKTRYNLNSSGNYRNKKVNIFGNFGYNANDNFNQIDATSYQNDLYLVETNNFQFDRSNFSYGFGMDFFLAEKHTLGVLYNGRYSKNKETVVNKIIISPANNINEIDSVLVADSDGTGSRLNNTVNLNYRYSIDKNQSLNIDLDYGNYMNDKDRTQPNIYFNATEDTILYSKTNQFTTPNDIKIYAVKLDYEREIGKGQFSVGTKYSRVETNNTFKVFDVEDEMQTLDIVKSNLFDYTENVYAGYVNYARALGEKWNFSAGLRLEQTSIKGNLTAFDPNLQEPPTQSKYLSWFPSAGLTWQVAEKHALALNYGRRINRPDYNVLNPFKNQLSELSLSTGNPELLPEIVNNVELGYTVAYKYNFKIAYSRTIDKITRLIGPDENDPRANYISWDNLASETVYSINASLPFSVKKVWDIYFNLGASHVNNQANYGDGAIVDVKVFTYNFYAQNTFKLPKEFKIELSGWYSGPGVWGGVFRYDANWSIDAGIQKEFFDQKLKVRLSVNNIFDGFGWRGVSEFDGLVSYGRGDWDNRFFTASVKYNFGNQNVKSRKRNTGIENESKRVE
ncbi:MAG: TonB-dependent receptor [Bacteroidetes bacterium]|nr:TonB-dependent receptor [Bacteroidota bacterium]